MKHFPRTVVIYCIAFCIMFGAFVISFQTLPPQIPLFYSLPDSDSQIVDLWYIALLPVLCFMCIQVNNVVFNKLFRGDQFIKVCLYVINVILIFFFTYIFVKILLLVS